jgi:hypothetical protein
VSQNLELSERQEMAFWCYPIVTDLVRERYLGVIGGAGVAVLNVVISHSHLWRARILDDSFSLRRARDELAGHIQQLGLPPDLVEDIDEDILDELMQVVTQRFHRSPVRAAICGQILLHVAKKLAFTPKPLAMA